MNPLIVKAIKMADQVRNKLGLNLSQPINIFDCCAELGVTVRFVDINMEGMYIHHDNPAMCNILISNQRPMPRRVYTCAHELGHHIFGHGTKVDVLTNETVKSAGYDNDELLVDAFAGALLMPILGVQKEFIKRGWKPKDAGPLEFQIISSVFNTGYASLITHCRINGLIDSIKANSLLKYSPGEILKSILGRLDAKSHFKFIDEHMISSVIDLEVSNYIILPRNIDVEGLHLEKFADTDYGLVYLAKKSGLIRAVSFDKTTSYFIRIQNSEYIGLAENRHLET